MTDFRDIDRAYDAYDQQGSWAQVDRGLIYTCNGGWIDFGHMSITNSRPFGGHRPFKPLLVP